MKFQFTTIVGIALSQLILVSAVFAAPFLPFAQKITDSVDSTDFTDSIDFTDSAKILYGNPMTVDVAAHAREATQKSSRDFLLLDIPYQTRGEVDYDLLPRCEDMIARAFQALPEAHVKGVKNLTLSFDPTMRRGLAGGNTMIIRCVNISEKDLVGVITHELGHIVDTGVLNPSKSDKRTTFVDRGKIVYSSDPSVEMYSVSWEDNRSFTGQRSDAVSGYATSNPYEEFAETYAMYVLHGPLFRFYAAHNRSLDAKYDFMKDVVFDGAEYDFAPEKLPTILESRTRVYDVTRLDYDMESFLTPRESSDSNLKS